MASARTNAEPPAAPEEPAVPDLSAKGQWAELGGNDSTNAALIVDLKESTNTMIVLGDFFKTNAIVQTNLFIDNDQIDVAGGIPAFVIGDENKADNIAEFEQRPGVFFAISGYFAGLQWNVDVVQGDFYDINLVTQKNLLHDNDVAVQESENVHYEAHLGENEQLNLTQIFDGEIHYDLIVVLGSFHGANMIFQYNVLLDSDILKTSLRRRGGRHDLPVGRIRRKYIAQRRGDRQLRRRHLCLRRRRDWTISSPLSPARPAQSIHRSAGWFPVTVRAC